MKPKRNPGRPTEADTPLARLRARIKEKGKRITQERAAVICAALLGTCDPRTYRYWESGEREPPPVIFMEFRRLAGLDGKRKAA